MVAVPEEAAASARSLGERAVVLGVGDVAAVDPHFHADAAEGRARLVEPVVDVRAERVQGHAALAVELRAGHLGAAQTTRALHPDAPGARALGGLDALAHGAPGGDARGDLLGDALRDELGVGFGVLDLEDVELDRLARQLLQIGAQAVGLRAATADDDAGPGRVDVHDDALGAPLDVDARDPRAVERLLDHPADLDVLLDEVGVSLTGLGRVGEPLRAVVRGDSESEPGRVDLLPHYRVLLFFALFFTAATSSPTMTVMWLVRLRMRFARPCARGWMRFIVGPSST